MVSQFSATHCSALVLKHKSEGCHICTRIYKYSSSDCSSQKLGFELHPPTFYLHFRYPRQVIPIPLHSRAVASILSRTYTQLASNGSTSDTYMARSMVLRPSGDGTYPRSMKRRANCTPDIVISRGAALKSSKGKVAAPIETFSALAL